MAPMLNPPKLVAVDTNVALDFAKKFIHGVWPLLLLGAINATVVTFVQQFNL